MRHFEKTTKYEKIYHLFWHLLSSVERSGSVFFKILWPVEKTWTLQSSIPKIYNYFNIFMPMLYTISKKGYPKKLSTIPTWKLDKQWLEQSIASRKINFPKKLVKLTHHTYASNIFTNFDHPYLKAGWTAVAAINSVAQNQFPLVNHVLLNSLLVLKESRQQNCPQISFEFTGLAQHQDL